MPPEPQRKRHVGKVSVTLSLVCPGKHPDELTRLLGIQPTYQDHSHTHAHFTSSGLQGATDNAVWCYNTGAQLSSPDVNDHLRHVLSLFLPLQSRIEELRPPPAICFYIYWESIADLAGPQIDRSCIAGLAKLGASLDIHVTKTDHTSPA